MGLFRSSQTGNVRTEEVEQHSSQEQEALELKSGRSSSGSTLGRRDRRILVIENVLVSSSD